MKIILKNGASYNIRRTDSNIIDKNKLNFYDDIPEDVKSVYVSNIILKTEEGKLLDLFEIEKDFTEDNIEEVTFVTDNGTQLKDRYNAVGTIDQTITDFINEAKIVLFKYNK